MCECKKNFKIVGAFFSITLIMFLVSCGEDCKFNSIKSEALPDAVVGQEYYHKIEIETSCTPASSSVEKTDGSLPKGITLEGTGELMGIPTEAGTDTFTVNVRICFGTNGFEYTDCTDKTKVFSLKVK